MHEWIHEVGVDSVPCCKFAQIESKSFLDRAVVVKRVEDSCFGISRLDEPQRVVACKQMRRQLDYRVGFFNLISRLFGLNSADQMLELSCWVATVCELHLVNFYLLVAV